MSLTGALFTAMLDEGQGGTRNPGAYLRFRIETMLGLPWWLSQ